MAFTGWVTIDPMSPDIPDKAGVYVFIIGCEAVYIGQSNNLRFRMSQHKVRYGYAANIITPWGDFPDRLGVKLKYRVSRRMGDWAMWEIRLINRLRPRFNQRYTGKQMSRVA